MTEPVKQLQLTGYAGLQAGNVKSTTLRYTDAGAVLGAEAKCGNAFLRGQIGAGTAFSGKVQAGYDFDLGKNMGLELSAKAQAGRAVKPTELNAKLISNHIINIQNSNTGEVITEVISNQSDSNIKTKVPNGEMKAGAEAMLTYNGKRVKAGIGAEAGVHKGSPKELTANVISYNEISINYEDTTEVESFTDEFSQKLYEGDKAKFYATPTASVEVKLSKNNSLKMNADRYEQNLKFVHKF